MLYYLRGTDLFMHPNLACSMFQDRRAQFRDRLKWEVAVDQFGNERDQYDGCNPHYVIVADGDFRHVASLRLLPSTGPTMINDHFLDTLDGVPIRADSIWECTRLCISSKADAKTVPQLLAATGILMKELEISNLVGVFSNQMLRAYARLGARPEILGSSVDGEEVVHAGMWAFEHCLLSNLIKRSGMKSDEIYLYLANSPVLQVRTLERAV